eukprot:scaffold1269_cov400-Prasinococcus_capsulatus_cf.AAC.7
MEFEFSSAAKQLEAEQAKRKEEAAQRLRKQREQRALQQREREERERLQLERKLAAEQAAESERLEVEAKLELNRGTYFSQRYKVEVSCKAIEKGISRHKDKISLPRSAEHVLSPARRNGALCFEVAAGSKRTHSMLLDFSAAEGKVELPPHVAGCLSEPGQAAPDHVTVSYSLLQEGVFARLQPISSDFQKNVIDLEASLLQTLKGHATLTEGEILDVECEGVCYQVRVLELRPSPQVKVIETDLEVEIAPSVEYEDRIAEEELARRRAQEAAARLAAERAQREREEREAAEARLLQEAKEKAIQRDAALDRLLSVACELLAPRSAAVEPQDAPHLSQTTERNWFLLTSGCVLQIEQFLEDDVLNGTGAAEYPSQSCELILEVAATGQRLHRVFDETADCSVLHTFVRASVLLHELKRLSRQDAGGMNDANEKAMSLICEGFQLVMGFGLASKKIQNGACSLRSEGVGRREKILVKPLS